MKGAISDFLNQICGVEVEDVSSADGQCECLIGAIVVCFYWIIYVCGSLEWR